MLIEKKELEAGDVVSMKLTTSDEVVGRFVRMSDNMLVIKKPFCLVPTQQGLALIPFMVSLPDDAEMNIDRNMVVTHIKSRKEVADAYLQQTSSIMTASQIPTEKDIQG